MEPEKRLNIWFPLRDKAFLFVKEQKQGILKVRGGLLFQRMSYFFEYCLVFHETWAFYIIFIFIKK